jgi:hypothetical protein
MGSAKEDRMEFKIVSSEQRGKRRGARRHKSRLYIWPEAESVAEQFVYRTNRPWQEYRTMLPAIFKHFGLSENIKARWSQYAGCSMCPCSPGFVLDLTGSYLDDYYVVVTAEDPEKLKSDGEIKPERVEAIKRVAAGGI